MIYSLLLNFYIFFIVPHKRVTQQVGVVLQKQLRNHQLLRYCALYKGYGVEFTKSLQRMRVFFSIANNIKHSKFFTVWLLFLVIFFPFFHRNMKPMRIVLFHVLIPVLLLLFCPSLPGFVSEELYNPKCYWHWFSSQGLLGTHKSWFTF